MSRHWPRWITASIAKHYNDRKDTLVFFIEGEEQKTKSIQDYFELRVNGPHIKKQSGFYKLEVVINLLIIHKMNQQDVYQIQRNEGIVAEATTDFIPVYKYGTGVSDTQSLLGCLQRCEFEGEDIKIVPLGQVNPEVKEQQSVVQAYYKMLLET